MSFPIIVAVMLGFGQPIQGRTCPAATAPERLPDVSAVVDVEALRVALAPVLAEAPAAADMIFSIRFRADGQREWVERVRGDADSRLQLSVARLIAEQLK